MDELIDHFLWLAEEIIDATLLFKSQIDYVLTKKILTL